MNLQTNEDAKRDNENAQPKKKSKRRCSTNDRCSTNERCSTNDFLSETQKDLIKRFTIHSGIVNPSEKRMIEGNAFFVLNTITQEKTQIVPSVEMWWTQIPILVLGLDGTCWDSWNGLCFEETSHPC